jgi:hypothetical protein
MAVLILAIASMAMAGTPNTICSETIAGDGNFTLAASVSNISAVGFCPQDITVAGEVSFYVGAATVTKTAALNVMTVFFNASSGCVEIPVNKTANTNFGYGATATIQKTQGGTALSNNTISVVTASGVVGTAYIVCDGVQQ